MHGGSSARFPTKPTEKLKIEKMYAIKQIKICAEYRDMLPRPRLDLSGTPGLRPIGLSPGSWQTSLGLGSMSRYSAQILICIIYIYIYIYMSQMSSVFSHESAQRNDAGHLIDKMSLKQQSFCYQWFRVSTLQANATKHGKINFKPMNRS